MTLRARCPPAKINASAAKGGIMNAPQRLSFAGFVLLLLDVGAAAGVRIAYLTTATDNGRGTPALSVQGGGLDGESPLAPGGGDERQTGVLGQLVRNLSDHQWDGAKAPLADAEERTGHVAPGYPWLIAQLVQFDP